MIFYCSSCTSTIVFVQLIFSIICGMVVDGAAGTTWGPKRNLL